MRDMLCDGERPEREHDQAMEDYEREVREYKYRIIEYLDAWVAFDYRLHAKAGDQRQPLLAPAPIHPDDRPASPDEEIPY